MSGIEWRDSEKSGDVHQSRRCLEERRVDTGEEDEQGGKDSGRDEKAYTRWRGKKSRQRLNVNSYAHIINS